MVGGAARRSVPGLRAAAGTELIMVPVGRDSMRIRSRPPTAGYRSMSRSNGTPITIWVPKRRAC